MYHNHAHGDEHRGRSGMRKDRLIAVAASAATVSLLSSCATGLFAAAPASASISKPPACAPLSPTSTTPPTLKPTTITTIEQAYYCILANYYYGPVLDDRTVLVPAFAALTQQLQRRGLDRADATVPALTGNRDHDIAAFAAVYQRILAELPASTRLVQALAEATMHGMVNSLTDDHVLWLRHATGVYPLGMIISSTRGALSPIRPRPRPSTSHRYSRVARPRPPGSARATSSSRSTASRPISTECSTRTSSTCSPCRRGRCGWCYTGPPLAALSR